MTSPSSTDRPPRVSVIMAVYNAERYLAEAVESVLAQSFSDFEFLVHDDGSVDGSRDILQGFAMQDARLTLSFGENLGPAAARNAAVARARGEFLAVMDADDICFPDRFEKQITYLDANPDCVVLGGWALMVDASGRPIAPLKPPADHERIDANNLSGRTSFIHPSVMIRHDAFLEAGRYDESYRRAQDKELWLRMAETGRLANLAEFCVRYRVHMKSISTSQHELQYESSRKASAEAAARRGIPDTFQRARYRSDGSADSERDFALRYGWQAWSWGFRATARHFARLALRLDPLSFAAWKLLLFGSLRPSPKTVDVAP